MEHPPKISPKWMRTDWIWIALIGLLVQALWGMGMEYPSYMDAYYYATNGQRLADGFGFTEEVIWQYLDNPEGLPTPSHTYWMPMPSILAAVGYQFGDSFRAAQLPFWLLAGLLPLLTFVISRQFTQARWQIWMACLLTASGGYYSRFFNQPTTFAPFAWFGGLCLLFLAWGHVRGHWKWWLLAGLTAGLAHLTRADGVLLLLVGVWVWLFALRDGRRQGLGWGTPLGWLLLLVAGYGVVMGGWFWRNMQVMGRPLSAAGTQTIFLTNYNDLFAYGRTFDLVHYLDWGWMNIVQSKLFGLNIATQTFIAVSGFIFLFPFLLGAWIKWGREAARWPLLRPMTWYAVGLFLAMSLVFTLPGWRGGLLHSSAALWAWFMTLVAGGVDLAVDWVAARRSHWQPARAKRMFAAMFLVVAFLVSWATLRSEENLEAEVYEVWGEMLPETAVVMSGNAPGFYYHTGRPSISVPNEPLAGMLQAAQRYGAAYMVLDENRPPPLAPLYDGEITDPAVELIESWDHFQLYRFHWVGEQP